MIVTRDSLFKVLSEDGISALTETRWNLPTRAAEGGSWQPGAWMPAIRGQLIVCKVGYHLARLQDLRKWLYCGSCIWVAEAGEGEGAKVIEAADKIVCDRARLLARCEHWTPQAARLFACNCVDHVLDNLPAPLPDIQQLRAVLTVARRYAHGEATYDELSAARDVAATAAPPPVGYRPRTDVWTAAAWTAAAKTSDTDASHGVSWTASWAAADRAHEKEWQQERLLAYLNGQVRFAAVLVNQAAKGGTA